MKLGKQKGVIIKSIFFLVFMMFSCGLTISYLYKTNNITNSEYINFLLSDSYGDDFYKKIVEMINKIYNPLNVIELKEVKSNNFNLLNSSYINEPIIYIYNEDRNQEYRLEYNIKPNVYLASYFLTKSLNENGIDSIMEESDLLSFSKNNNISIDEAVNIYEKDKMNNFSNIKYILNISRSNDIKKNTTVKINNINYALIGLYANEKNVAFVNKINSKLNEKYKGISKIYFDYEYNNSINIEFGGCENYMKEVLNSIEVFTSIFKEVI